MSSTVTEVRSEDDARHLARHLNGPRRRPVAVTTVPAGRSLPYIDVKTLLDHVGDLVEVFLLHNGEESWTFSQAMAPGTQVYGGAGRVYPLDTAWVRNPRLSPLRLAFDEAQGQTATRALISDALAMAHAAGLLDRPQRSAAVPVQGEVKGLSAGRAVVRLSDGRFLTVAEELISAGVPTERLLRAGQDVVGEVGAEGRLDIRSMLLDPEEALSAYSEGSVVLARVHAVAAQQAVLLLHPQVPVVVSREQVSSNPLDLLTALLSPGEVVRARVVSCGTDWRLQLDDVDDDEPVEQAASLTPQGPPWLVEPDTSAVGAAGAPTDTEARADAVRSALDPRVVGGETTGDEATEVEVTANDATAAAVAGADGVAAQGSRADVALDRRVIPAPVVVRGLGVAGSEAKNRPAVSPLLLAGRSKAAGPAAEQGAGSPQPGALDDAARLRLELERARAHVQHLEKERQGFLRQQDLAARETNQLQRTVEGLETELRDLRTRLRKTRVKTAANPSAGRAADWFADPEEQFRYDVQHSWVCRIPAAEKAELPLPDYDLGPGFLESLRLTHGADPHKVAGVVVEVLTGRARHLRGRGLHQLRTGSGGNDPPVTRADGASCWRVALQANTPAARRLHYWVLPSGRIELSRVVVHDDTEP